MIRGGIAREFPDDWRCPACKRWFPADEPDSDGLCGGCVDDADEEADAREAERWEDEP